MFDQFKHLGKGRFEKRVEALNNIGNVTVGKVIRSKKDKYDDPRKQRKERKWQNDW